MKGLKRAFSGLVVVLLLAAAVAVPAYANPYYLFDIKQGEINNRYIGGGNHNCNSTYSNAYSYYHHPTNYHNAQVFCYRTGYYNNVGISAGSWAYANLPDIYYSSDRFSFYASTS